MNQDQVIRWLMENIDAEALAEANRNGSTIMYFANVANRWPQGGNQAAAPRARVGRVQPVAEEAEPERAPARQPARRPAQREEAVDLNENENNAQAARRPAARPARQGNGNADRCRVGNY